jgi:hypothetical protein
MKRVPKCLFYGLLLVSLTTANSETAVAQHLFDNRGASGTAALVSASLTTAVATAFVAIDAILPLVGIPPFPPFPIVVTGRSLGQPKIYNLYWDNDWDSHNPAAFSRANIDSFSTKLASSGYFGPAGQYGVGLASFIGSKQGDALFDDSCGPRTAGTSVDFFEVLGWVTCQAGAVNLEYPEIPNPLFPGLPLLTQGLIPSLTGVPAPDDNVVYVVYLPAGVSLTQGGSSSCNAPTGNNIFDAYHFMSAVPETQFTPLPAPGIQSFAFAVIVTDCSSNFDKLTADSSHEIIESATDPIFLLGWLDNNVLDPNNITAIATDAEAADICAKLSSPPVRLSNGVNVATYWSNADNACVPMAPTTVENISLPKVSRLGTTFITNQSLITLTGTAPPGSPISDIPFVHFHFWRNGTTEPAETVCSIVCNFMVNKNDGNDGRYSLKFNTSTTGTVESERTDSLTLDDTPPQSTLSEAPEVLGSQPYVTSATQFALSASDGSGVGLDSMFFRYFSGATAPAFTKITANTGNFKISGADGLYEVDSFSSDLLGNNEATQSKVVFLDNTAPQSTLTAGSPQFQGSQLFVTNNTPFTLTAIDTGVGVDALARRYFPAGGIVPGFVVTSGSQTTFNLSGVDGPYEIDTLSVDRLANTEMKRTTFAYLDDTAPLIAITQPASTQYTHSATLTLNYSVSDGAGSGVANTTPLLDGNPTLAGHGLSSGQPINLLTELPLGDHTFTVTSVDKLGNSRTSSVTFTIIVTAQSIADDVNQFLSRGLITSGNANALLSTLANAASARARGQCGTAANIYQAFISQVQLLVTDPNAKAILIADAQYLITHCP